MSPRFQFSNQDDEGLPSLRQRRELEEMRGYRLENHLKNLVKTRRKSEYHKSFQLKLKSDLRSNKFHYPPEMLLVADYFKHEAQLQ